MTFIRFFLLASILLFSALLPAQYAPGIRWAVTAGGPDYLEYASDLDLDESGNVYLTGTYRTGAQFGDSIISAMGPTGDLFVASYSHTGAFRWIHHTGGSLPDEGHDIYAGYPGYVFVTGYAKGGALPPPGLLHAKDIYVSMLDTGGVQIWNRNLNGNNFGEGNAIIADAAGNSYVAGVFNTKIYLPSGDTITSNGFSDWFVAKFTPTGNIEWIKNFGSTTGDDYAYGIGLDADGYVYAAGYFNGTMTSGPVSLTSIAGKDAAILKLNPSGDAVWGVAVHGKGADQILSMNMSDAGHIYVSGTFSDSLFFPADTLLTLGGTDCWVARFDSTGSFVWAQSFGGTGTQSVQDLSMDSKERIALTGYFSNSLTYDALTLTSTGYDDMFVLRLDSLGNLLLADQYGNSTTSEYSQGVLSDDNGNISFCGLYSNTLILDTVLITSVSSSEDIFATLWCDTTTLELLSVSGPPHCINDNFTVSFEATGCFDDNNIFYAEMSDPAGSFASPDTVGFTTGIFADHVICTIPATVTGGPGYLIRLVSTDPPITTPPSSPAFPIVTSTSNPVNITGDSIICIGDSITLDAGPGYVSYVWNTGDFTQVISVFSPGLYYVDAQDSLGCTTRGEHFVSLCVAVDPSTTSGQWTLFPNPSAGTFTLSSTNPIGEPLTYRITDITGRQILVGQIPSAASPTTQIQLCAPQGIYLLQLQSSHQHQILRLIIE